MAYDFPSSPSVGQIFAPAGGPSWTWNGTAWMEGGAVASGAIIDRYYTTSGTWTKPAGLRYAEVTVVGGGGGSAALGATAAGTSAAAPGGGGGGTVRKLYAASDMAASLAYVVGTGGTTAPGSGGASQFAGLTGGGGGTGTGLGSGSALGTAAGGAGGTATGGDLNVPGAPGGVGVRCIISTSSAVGGDGGGSMLGPTIPWQMTTGTGLNGRTGSFPGGGGRGAAAGASQGAAAGGAGADGLVLVREIY